MEKGLTMKLYRTFALLGAMTCLTAYASAETPAKPVSEEGQSSMLTIITSAEPETQLMALILTNSARAKGEQPHILLCNAAGDLALAQPPEAATAPLQPKGFSPQGLLKKLMADGVDVDVCAIYLPNRPFGAEALMEGVGVATPDRMGEKIARPGETILSF